MNEEKESPPGVSSRGARSEGPEAKEHPNPAAQRTPNACSGPGCGTCFITFYGTEDNALRLCEIEQIGALRRELASMLAEGGGSDE